MNKLLLSAFLTSALLLSACGDTTKSNNEENTNDNNNTEVENENNNNTEAENVEIDSENNNEENSEEDNEKETEKNATDDPQDYTMKDLEYAVPESWSEDVADEYLKYYYPEDAMLMVGLMELEDSITDDEVRAQFLEGFSSGLEEVDLTSETEITIDGKTAYQYDMNHKFPDQPEDYETSLVVFDYDIGIMNFVMATLSDSDKDYSSEFEDVLDSIEYTDEATND